MFLIVSKCILFQYIYIYIKYNFSNLIILKDYSTIIIIMIWVYKINNYIKRLFVILVFVIGYGT